MTKRKAVVYLIAFVVAVSVGVASAMAASFITKKELPRDDVYYEIANDGGDYGNYIELYHVPIPGSSTKLFCVVYSDKIGDGGGAGESCNWDAFNRHRSGDH